MPSAPQGLPQELTSPPMTTPITLSPQSDWFPTVKALPPGGVMTGEGPVWADWPSPLSPGTTISRK